ncbi:MAG: hypothetical protein ACOYNO_03400 [Saprospiraceae bacterium]
MRSISGCLLVLYIWTAVAPLPFREELGKLPSLWKHYQTHLAIEPGASFLVFWEQHYGAGYQSHRNSHDHSDLPGKTKHHHHQFCCAQPVLLPPVLPVFCLYNPPMCAPERKVFLYGAMMPTQSFSDIWQPPKG